MWSKKFWIAVISQLVNRNSNSSGRTDPPAPESSKAQIHDARPMIRPVLPSNTQARILGGIALLMVLVIAFSGRKATREQKPAASPPPQIVEPSQSRIQEYRTTIDDAARQLAAEEAELTHAKQALAEKASERPAPAPASNGTYPSIPLLPNIGTSQKRVRFRPNAKNASISRFSHRISR